MATVSTHAEFEGSTKQLVAFLNDKFKKKRSGQLFTINDAIHYRRRGNTPYMYGGGYRLESNNDIDGNVIVKAYPYANEDAKA